MKKKILAGLAVGVIMFGMDGRASATTMTIDGGWYSADEYMTAPNWFTETWSFVATTNVNLYVTDFAVASDLFEVYTNGVLLGSTSIVADNAAYTLDYDTAYADPSFSKGMWGLAAGTYEVSIFTTHIPYSYPDSTVALKVDSAPVPEPATMLLMGTGLAGLVGARRKKIISS